MRALAVLAAALHVVLCGAAAFLLVFYATFPFENQSAEEAAADDWLIGAAAIGLIPAIVIGGTVIARRPAATAVAFAGECAVGGIVLSYVLGETHQSDGRLVLFAAALAVTAITAVTATRLQKG